MKSSLSALAGEQKGLWLDYRLYPQDNSYNIHIFFSIKGDLNVQRFIDCQEIYNKYFYTSRVRFTTEEGIPYQYIHEEANPSFFEYIDLTVKMENQESPLNILKNKAAQAINLEKDNSYKSFLIKSASNAYYYGFIQHHILADSATVDLYCKGLSIAYNEGVDVLNEKLPQKTLEEYVRFSNPQSVSRQYWENKLKNCQVRVDFGSDDQGKINNVRGVEVFDFSNNYLSAIQKSARECGVSPYLFLKAALGCVIYKYWKQKQFIINYPLDSRAGEFALNTGNFIKLMPLKMDVNPLLSFKDFVKKLNYDRKNDFNNLNISSMDILDICSSTGDGRDRKANVLFSQSKFEVYSLKLTGCLVESVAVFGGDSGEDISLTCDFTDPNLKSVIYYNKNTFTATFVREIESYFKFLVKKVSANLETRIEELESVTEETKERILKTFNFTTKDYNSNKTIHSLFEEKAAENSDKTALIFRNHKMTYRELNERANALGSHLRNNYGIQPGDLVGVLLNRSENMIISLLGILKAGGSYVPIDSGYPVERINYILKNSQAKGVISQASVYDRVDIDAPVIDIDKATEENSNRENLSPAAGPEDIAYVIYTSGSTGNPKGVIINHRGAVNTILDVNDRFNVTENDCCFAISSYSFDLSVYDIFGLLAAGGSIVLPSGDETKDPAAWAAHIKKNKVTLWNSVPALMQLLADWSLKQKVILDLRLVFLSGDWIPLSLPEKIQEVSPAGEVISLGGATEASIWSIYYPIQKIDPSWKSIPYGKPLGNQSFYVLDKNLSLCPIGIPGDLYIGGEGVAQGYLHNKALTAEKFIEHPFQSQGIIYKTGDLGRYFSDGNIEFLGRSDHQVKIRGFRIELGEIETALIKIPQVKAAIALAVGDSLENKILIAYIVTDEEIHPQAMKDKLTQFLPEYMIPSFFIRIPNIPLTPNGKVDRKALPALEEQTERLYDYCTPENETEEKLLAIWQKILDRERIGVEDNFFEQGGHSLKLITLALETNRILKSVYPLNLFYRYPSIRSFMENVVNGKDRKEEYINLEEESQLPEDIYPLASFKPGAKAPQKIFLTGATGFLGAFLLNQLLSTTEATMYCLVRGSGGYERLIRGLKKKQLYSADFSHRIIAIEGDISRSNLGVEKHRYDWLCEEIDIIFHNAVIMNHNADYFTLKKGNVGGAIEILQLAAAKKTKPIHYTSTVGIFDVSSPENNIPADETTDIDKEQHPLSSGYGGSKWVAEKLMQRAKSRGMPINIYRLGLVTGDTDRGRNDPGQWFHQLLVSCVELNKTFYGMPQFRIQMAPVDFTAKAMITLAMDHKSQNGIFHISAPENGLLEDYLQMNSPLALEAIPLKEWLNLAKAYQNQGDKVSVNILLSLFSGLNSDQLAEAQASIQIARPLDSQRTINLLKEKGVNFPTVGRRLIETYYNCIVQELAMVPEYEDT